MCLQNGDSSELRVRFRASKRFKTPAVFFFFFFFFFFSTVPFIGGSYVTILCSYIGGFV